MTPTAKTARKPSLTIGVLATLRAAFHLKGTGAPSAMRGRTVLSLIGLASLLVALLLSAAPASAFETHEYLSHLTGFTGPVSGVAVDGSSNVYAADEGARVVDRFGPSGSPLPFSAVEPYLEGAKLKGTPTGTGGSVVAFGDPTGVAVDDASGNVYVADTTLGVVDVFSSSGEYLSQLTGTPPSAPVSGPFGAQFGLAVTVDQATGDVFVSDAEKGVVDVFNSSGGYVSQFGSGVLVQFGQRDLVTVGVNDLTEDAYVADPRGYVFAFEGSGGFVSEWEGGGTPFHHYEGSGGVAVDQATGHVYVADNGDGVIDEFAASTSEEFVGDVNGTPAGPFGGETLRAVATNPVNGDLYVSAAGAVDIFGPDVLLPDATTGAASNVTASSATVAGTVDPDVVEVTSCVFEYRSEAEPEYGHHAQACSTLPGNGTAPVPVEATLSGLAPNTTYHYRLVAGNANGKHEGAEATVKTAGPPAIVSESAEVPRTKAGQTSLTLQASIDPDARETTYTFEYGEANHYGTSIPVPAGEIPAGETAVAVSAEATGLKVGTTYHYRVVAHNEYEPTTDGPDQTVSTQPPALVEEEFSTDVRSTSATLHAKIDPFGLATSYRFVYGPSAACEGGECSTPLESLGSGEGGVEVEAHLQGLAAGQAHHYRLVATNHLGVSEGEQFSFTTQTGGEAGLPDGRQWELVSPPDKHGAQLIGAEEHTYLQAAANGHGIVYVSSAPTESQPRGNGEILQVLARRESNGWSNQDLAVPHTFPIGVTENMAYTMFSPELTAGVLQPQGSFEPAISAEATEQTPYLRDSETGVFTPLVTPLDDTTSPLEPFGEETVEGQCRHITCGPRVIGATPDLSHVVIGSGTDGYAVPLLKGAPTISLYEWSAGGLSRVSQLPENPPPVEGRPVLGGFQGSVTAGAVSNDGTRVFWSDEVGLKPVLFLRDTTRGETIEIGGGDAQFEAANTTGSLVFYSGKECEVLVGKTGLECRLVTGEGGKALEDGTVLAISEDGAWVYFKEQEAIYVRHSNEPAKLIANNTGNIRPPTAEGALKPQEDPWRASPNGLWFAFMSDRSLTGYDNHDITTGQPDEEVYLYNATGEHLVCASCNPTGARPHGTNGLNLSLAAYSVTWEQGLAASVPGWTPYASTFAVYDPRFLSDSGRLFFNALDALVPKDVNEQVDVYEFDPTNVGNCTTTTQTGTDVYTPTAEGCIALISNGEHPEESVFEDASETGEDVFFLSSARLSTQDLDGSLSLWDAHSCTTVSPCLPTPASQPPACTTEASCKASPSPQPGIYGPPSSATFNGPGNVAAVSPPVKKVTKKTVKCKRGFVKKKVKKKETCVKKKSKKRAKKSAHTNRRPGR